MNFWIDYGGFLLETVTFVIAVLILLAGIIAISSKGKHPDKLKIRIKNLNDKYQDMQSTLKEAVLSKTALKHYEKELKKTEKQRKKDNEKARKNIFVLRFNGDIRASAVENLRDEITAILTTATPRDEVLVCLESPGGMVHAYGLAASQLERIKAKNIPLIIVIDKVAASGGYLMACVGDRILAAPFAIVGSIGVLAQIPNFNRLLKKNNIDFEQLHAGEYKRTISVFGENTREARHKMQEQLEEIHFYFKEFITQNRPQVHVDDVATGEHWLASRALDLHLVDELTTSDDYLLAASEQCDIYDISSERKRSLMEKLFQGGKQSVSQIFDAWADEKQRQETLL